MNARIGGIVLAVSAAFIAVLLTIAALDRWVLQPPFERLQQIQAEEDSARVQAAITQQMRQLAALAADWAVWDDAYAFAEKPDPAFIQSNLSDFRQLEKNAQINVGLLLNRAGRLLYAGTYDSDLGGPVTLADFTGDPPPVARLIQPVLNQGQPLSGLLRTEYGLLLLAAHPILDTQGRGPLHGAVLFGRFLDMPLLRTLTEQTQAAFELLAMNDPRLPESEWQQLRAQPAGARLLHTALDGRLFTDTLLTGLNGQAVALLRVPVRQDIASTAYATGRTLGSILGVLLLALLLGGGYLCTRPPRDQHGAVGTAAWVSATLSLLIGASLTAGLYLELQRNSRDDLQRRFQEIAGTRAQLLIERFRDRMRDLSVVQRFFESSAQVDRNEFRQFVAPLLDDRGFTALEWLPRVNATQRTDFEAAARRDGLQDFQFTERDAAGHLVPAAARDEYFPVYYLEPLAGHEPALGYAPAASHPLRGAVLDRARDSGQISLSTREVLVQDTTTPHPTVVAFAPVYANPDQYDPATRRQRLRGFVAGLIRLDLTVERAVAETAPVGLLLRLLDRQAPQEWQLLFERDKPRLGSATPDPQLPLHYAIDFPLADRLWCIEIQPNSAFIAAHLNQGYRWIPLVGTLLTLLATLYLFSLMSQRQRAEALVAVRTADLRASEERFRALHEASFGGIAIHDQGVIVECNQGLSDMTGFRRDELLGMNGLLLIAPEWRAVVMNHIRSGYDRAYEAFGLRCDGTVYALEIRGKNIPYRGKPARVTEFRDISERRQAEERQRLSAAVLDAAQEAIIVTNAAGRIIAVNPAFTALSGYPQAEVLGRNPRFLQAEHQSDAYFTALWQTLARDGRWQGEFQVRCQDGSLCITLTTVGVVRDGSGQVTHYVITAADITHLKETEQRIEYLAYHDALTGLPNRTLLAQRAELALALAARHREEVTVLFLDLDRFKEVNDSLGHAEGDALLMQAAQRIRHLVRAADTVCRLGGDEFVLLLPETGQTGAAHLLDHLMACFREPFVLAGHSLQITLSVGLAIYPHDGANFTELLKNADTALYRAKQDGRNTGVFYAPEMNVATFERLVLESQLRRAIETDQLRVHFQPKVRLSDGALVGAEALIRWQHPDHGLILPGRFIPMAEASDLIVALGDWILDAVCRQLAIWRGMGLPPLTVAVNLAARHFRDPGCVDRIEQLLRMHGLNAWLLELELTESTLLEVGARTAETLLALRRMGLGLAIDDFGTGYSSLGYLKRLPITALKIDQSFVRDLVSDPDDRILSATIVALGHSLGLQVIAEGVENAAQQRILQEQGCDLAQGFWFGRPMSADDFVAWIAARA